MNDNDVLFARTAAGGDKVELRGLAPADLAQALDALAMADDMDRNTYVVKVLGEHVAKEIHKTIVRTRMLKGNPLHSESKGTTQEQAA
ncbi:MAG: hypothetical protein V4614_15055 [Pseudomonadota bacterium]